MTCRRVEIERVQSLPQDVFHERYVSGLGRPVVITGALDDWPALSKWTFDWFKSHYGADVVHFRGLYKSTVKVMKLVDYLDYLDEPERGAKGFWFDAVANRPCVEPPLPSGALLYLAWNVFPKHPELLEDVRLSPRFVDDWLPLLPPALHEVLSSVRNYFSTGILIGPSGSSFGLHRDVLSTHAYLAQIVGHKRCLMFSPTLSTEGDHGRVNPQADFASDAPFRDAVGFECTLHPGEVLFIPSGWWHSVVGLGKTITVNYNFFNRGNFSSYMTELIREIPSVLTNLEQFPIAKKALGIAWTSRGFDGV